MVEELLCLWFLSYRQTFLCYYKYAEWFLNLILTQLTYNAFFVASRKRRFTIVFSFLVLSSCRTEFCAIGEEIEGIILLEHLVAKWKNLIHWWSIILKWNEGEMRNKTSNKLKSMLQPCYTNNWNHVYFNFNDLVSYPKSMLGLEWWVKNVPGCLNCFDIWYFFS